MDDLAVARTGLGPDFTVALQDQDFFPGVRQRARTGEADNASPNYDRIHPISHPTHPEPALT
jgi:hypothetical protein